jgi:dsDNA-binding SOS-regulon protein
MDQQLRQRQHASLDVFLNSARQQLTALMESDSLPGCQQNGEEKSTSGDEDSPKQTNFVMGEKIS